MIVFISDLHFVDETAGKHNIPASAFENFLANVEVHADKAKAKELKIAFLGDIFDILRTEEWFKEKEVDRPWGNNTAKMRERARAILSEIEKKTGIHLNSSSRLLLKNVLGILKWRPSIYRETMTGFTG